MNSFTDLKHINLPQFNRKLNRQQQALFNEIKKYRNNYLQKTVKIDNIQSYFRFSKETIQIITSYCKNIFQMSPQKIIAVIQEFNIISDDILTKFYQQFKNNHFVLGSSAQNNNNEVIDHRNLELCMNCKQKIKKIQIDNIKKQIFNEDLKQNKQKQSQNNDFKQQEEDVAFFAQLNQILNLKESQILKNQIQINIYKDVVLESIKSMNSLNHHFNRDSILMPSHSWLQQAKQQMQAILKNKFSLKLSQWIQKMIYLFQTIRKKKEANKRRDIEVQTMIQTNADIFDMKKKIIICNDKIEKGITELKSRQSQIFKLNNNIKDLNIMTQYYKGQINALLQEITAIKIQNQAIRQKLYRVDKKLQEQKRSKQTIALDSYKNLNQFKRTSARRSKFQIAEGQGLPIIKPDVKKKKRQSQVSISTQNQRSSLHQSKRGSNERHTYYRFSQEKQQTMRNLSRQKTPQNSLPRTQKVQISQNVTINNDKTQLQDKLQAKLQEKLQEQFNSQNIRNQQHKFSCRYQNTNDIIKQEDQQIPIQEFKKNVQEASKMMKQNMIKKQKNQKLKQFLNNTSSGNIKKYIKKVSHKKMNQIMQNSLLQNTTSENIYDDSKVAYPQVQLQAPLSLGIQRKEDLISKIYKVLKQEGFIINANENQFKSSLCKNIQFQHLFSSVKAQNKEPIQTKFIKRNTVHCDDRVNLLSKRWNQTIYHIQQKKRQAPKLDSSLKTYFSIFSSKQNAYNYELSLTKNHLKGFAQLNKHETIFCQQLYKILCTLKQNNNKHYRQFCSFIRYPYQITVNQFPNLDIVGEMKFNSFHQYFQRILAMHVKCHKENYICSHLLEFKDYLIKNSQKVSP